MPMQLVKTESAFKTSVGDRVEIVSLNRRFMGSLVHNYMQKYIGNLAVVAKIVYGKKFPICIQPGGYTGYLFVKESEIKRF